MATNPIDLFDVLENEKISCPADLGGGFYLPQSVLDEYVREPHITACCNEEGVPEGVAVTIDKSTRKIFVILLLSGNIKFVGLMLECGLQDHHLPLSLGQGGDNLVSYSGTVFRPSGGCWPRPFSRAVLAFLKHQWIVNPPILDDSGAHRIFDAECALPFSDRLDPLGTPTKQVFDCTIYPGLFRSIDDMAQPLRENGDAVTEWQTSGRRVAVKKFSRKHDFDREMEALRATRDKNHPRLIRYLSTIEKFSTIEKSNTYYILLPWADGSTLSKFWEDNGPSTLPRNRVLIRTSLNQLLQLADALQFLHSLNFRHGDLKPDNILHFTDPSGQVDNFVIADLGISRYHHLATGLRNAHTVTRSTTFAYEAPEVSTDQKHGRPRSRKYDTWSMGCIILEYIIWLLWDSEALDAFAGARTYPSFAFYRAQGSAAEANSPVVEPGVLEAMKVLRDDPRCAQRTALRDLINLVEHSMLIVDLDRRCEAAQLHGAVSEIVRKASATGRGMGDSYVLPHGAKAPATRPTIFQLRRDARGPWKSSIFVSRVDSLSTTTTTTITTKTSHSTGLHWNNSSTGSIEKAGRNQTYHGGEVTGPRRLSEDAASSALVAVAPKKASTWIVLVRSRSGSTDAGSRDGESIPTRLREYYALRRKKVYTKLRMWREKWTLSVAGNVTVAS